MKRVRLNREMLAWQYRVGHEDAMQEALKAHVMKIDNTPVGDMPRLLVSSLDGAEYSVWDTNYVMLDDGVLVVVSEYDFDKDYSRVEP